MDEVSLLRIDLIRLFFQTKQKQGDKEHTLIRSNLSEVVVSESCVILLLLFGLLIAH